MASGNGGQFAFAKIGSLYRDVNTVNLWGNFVSETLEHKFDEVKEMSISGRRDEPNTYQGVNHGAGDVVMQPHPNVIGTFFKAWYGTYVASTITGATSGGANSGNLAGAPQNWHKFTPNQSPFSAFTYLEPYNFMIYRDVGSAWLYKQSIVPQLKMEVQAGQLVKMTASIMARQVDLIQRTAGIQSMVSSGGRPWLWDAASVELSTDTTTANLAARTDFESLTFTFDLPCTGVSFLDGGKKYGEFSPTDFRKLTVDGTMSFRDQTAYQAFVNYNALRLRMTMLNVNSYLLLGNPSSADATQFLGYFGMRIILPQMKFIQWSAPITGPNRITAKFQARAEYSEAEGISSQVELLATANSADYTSVY
jgi:hypothetical protein